MRGLLSFVHQDRVGDREFDKKLVTYADNPTQARALLTSPEAKRAILAALETAGHIRIQKDRVMLDVREGDYKGDAPLNTVDDLERLARAAVAVVQALTASGLDPTR